MRLTGSHPWLANVPCYPSELRTRIEAVRNFVRQPYNIKFQSGEGLALKPAHHTQKKNNTKKKKLRKKRVLENKTLYIIHSCRYRLRLKLSLQTFFLQYQHYSKLSDLNLCSQQSLHTHTHTSKKLTVAEKVGQCILYTVAGIDPD